jgi:hypothetical protein
MSRFPDRCSALALALLCAMTGCRKSEYYCPGARLDNCNYLDAGQTCASNDDCSEPEAVCDVGGSMTCVQCIAPDQARACTGTTPACGDDHTCRGCIAHAECPASDACLPDGSCAEPSQVAYVKPPALGGTDNPSCTLAMPCTKVASALQTGRPYLKLAGTNDEGGTLSIDSRNVTLLAERGAKLVRTSNGLHLEIKGTSQIEIYDLEISGASGALGVGISLPTGNAVRLTLRRAKILNNAGGGITASGGTLTVSQSTISGNAGGGISMMNGTFVIVGNVFYLNGTGAALLGGVTISAPANAANHLEFNSFNQNTTANGVAPAIQCTIAGTFTARNNIMSENGTLTNMDQVGGNCLHAYSIARPGMMPPGVGNSSMDPLFVNTTTGDLHVRAGSPARGAADPNSNLTGPAERDIDGDVRTLPADIGADEVP